MKDLDTTWSHILARKLSLIREKNGLNVSELAERIGISSILNRQRKGNEEIFTKIGIAQKSIIKLGKLQR